MGLCGSQRPVSCPADDHGKKFDRGYTVSRFVDDHLLPTVVYVCSLPLDRDHANELLTRLKECNLKANLALDAIYHPHKGKKLSDEVVADAVAQLTPLDVQCETLCEMQLTSAEIVGNPTHTFEFTTHGKLEVKVYGMFRVHHGVSAPALLQAPHGADESTPRSQDPGRSPSRCSGCGTNGRRVCSTLTNFCSLAVLGRARKQVAGSCAEMRTRAGGTVDASALDRVADVEGSIASEDDVRECTIGPKCKMELWTVLRPTGAGHKTALHVECVYLQVDDPVVDSWLPAADILRQAQEILEQRVNDRINNAWSVVGSLAP